MTATHEPNGFALLWWCSTQPWESASPRVEAAYLTVIRVRQRSFPKDRSVSASYVGECRRRDVGNVAGVAADWLIGDSVPQCYSWLD